MKVRSLAARKMLEYERAYAGIYFECYVFKLSVNEHMNITHFHDFSFFWVFFKGLFQAWKWTYTKFQDFSMTVGSLTCSTIFYSFYQNVHVFLLAPPPPTHTPVCSAAGRCGSSGRGERWRRRVWAGSRSWRASPWSCSHFSSLSTGTTETDATDTLSDVDQWIPMTF